MGPNGIEVVDFSVLIFMHDMTGYPQFHSVREVEVE
jgi:hypothetical protein